ncbi:MAG: hypothetical protein ACJ780_16145, partial [Solirubrobacteraceae bacterium]
MSGRVIVDFHGDSAAGCAARGLCGYRGTLSWIPSAEATLQINASRARGHNGVTIDIFPAPGFGPGLPFGGVTVASVTRATDAASASTATCVDATSAGDLVLLPVRRGQVVFTLHSRFAPLLATRCAGPRDAAVLPLLPNPRRSLAAVRRGRVSVRIAATRSFSADGFAGTVTSNVVIRLAEPGRMTKVRSTSTSRPRQALKLSYHATLAGSVVEQITGGPATACGPLDACGVTGTVTIHPSTVGGNAQITAASAAGRPPPSLDAAAGLGDTGSQPGVSIFGQAAWPRGGTAATQIGRGSSQCRDMSSLGPEFVSLIRRRHQLIAVMTQATPPAPACAGPVLTNGSAGGLAAGRIPIGDLARRRIRILLRTGTSFDDYGYHVRVVPHLTLTLTRVTTRTGVFRNF